MYMCTTMSFIGSAPAYLCSLHTTKNFYYSSCQPWWEAWLDNACKFKEARHAKALVLFYHEVLGATWGWNMDAYCWTSSSCTMKCTKEGTASPQCRCSPNWYARVCIFFIFRVVRINEGFFLVTNHIVTTVKYRFISVCSRDSFAYHYINKIISVAHIRVVHINKLISVTGLTQDSLFS